MKRIHAVHLTSAHDASDVRIFRKECRSLAKEGYLVTLIAPHPCNEVTDGVHIRGVLSDEGRLLRMTRTVWRVYREALRQRGDVYHFHDPELIPVGLLLKALGKKVIYDAHEAYPQKILSKAWIPEKLRPTISWLFTAVEHCAGKWFDHVITADRSTAGYFGGCRVSVVANYPILTSHYGKSLSNRDHGQHGPEDRKHILIYAGGLGNDRGLQVMLDIASLLQHRNVELHLLGDFHNAEDERRSRELPNVRYLGYQPQATVYDHMARADLGLVLLQPVPAYLSAGENTTKLFEYMHCGLPVIASNFPKFREIVNGTACGICVDPSRPDRAARAILHLLGRPTLRLQLGENGCRAVLDTYNWESESKTLLHVYHKVLNDFRSPVSGEENIVIGKVHCGTPESEKFPTPQW